MSTVTATALAYCGAPPSPGEIWARWRLDPVVIAILVLGWSIYGFSYWRALRMRTRGIALREFLLGSAGWLIASLALISPLCPLSVSLFAARAAQHVILTVVAAPLVVLGRPLRCLAAAYARDGFDNGAPGRPAHSVAAALVFAVVVWFWHMPRPYEATFSSVAIYWTMHVSMFSAALWLWSCLLVRSEVIGELFASVGSAIQMGFLGAVITLAPRPFYSPHFLTTDAWGLSPLQDQQLGGVIMWVVGCTAFFAVAMIGAARSLSPHAMAKRGFRKLPIERTAALPHRPLSGNL